MGSGIIVDIENLVYCARYDKQISGFSQKQLTVRLIALLKEEARKYGALQCAYAALSMPPLPDIGQDQGKKAWWRYEARKENYNIVKALIDERFTVVIVPTGPDAADQELCAVGHRIGINKKITTVILGTSDGQPPFDELVQILYGGHQKICLASYDAIPGGLRKFTKMKHVMLGPNLRLACEEGIKSTAEIIGEEDEVSERKDSCQEAIRILKNGIAPTDPAHKLIYLIATILDRKKYFEMSFGYLLNYIQGELESVSVKIDKKELRAALYGLKDFTDIFETSAIYRLNRQSCFLECVRWAQ